VSPKAADPVGVVAVQIFASNEFQFRGMPLIDILMAKFRVVCPVLWGVYGSDKTEEGRARLGWQRDDNRHWVTEQRHGERMTGLGAGFAAISLRNFSRSNLKNPYPNAKYWEALANIVNVPGEQATQTHYIVLKAMIENYEIRFLEFYGNAALAALKKALVDFPRQAKERSAAVSALQVLPEVLRNDKKLTLTS
jgi:nucleoporin GLE1